MLCCKWCCISTFLALFSAFSSITATIVSQTIVVDPSTEGDFTTIQAAIDSVPTNNNRWICINIKEGVYREQITIPQQKPFIYLEGAGRENTFIEWNASNSIANATFTSQANNTIAKGITFVNSYNSPPSSTHNPIKAAVAALIQGDKSAFYECGFFGLQDTLWDAQGRHYFKKCTIEGAVDFIFGNGQSLYQSCTISVAAGALQGSSGYITAQKREKPEDTSGFVFKECNIDGNGKTFLGRPWRDYARVLFYNTQMSDVVVPQGWDAWNSTGHENQLTLSEYNCSGPGAMSSQRVRWEKKLNEEEVKQLTSTSFIDDDEGWINQASNILGHN